MLTLIDDFAPCVPDFLNSCQMTWWWPPRPKLVAINIINEVVLDWIHL